MNTLLQTLDQLSVLQHLLALLFLLGYALALGPVFGRMARQRAGWVALLAALGFSALTHP